MSVFMATAGLIAANIDGKVTKEEIDHIIQNLSNSNIFPKQFLETIMKSDVNKLFNASITRILELNSDLKNNLLEYFISVVLADKDISEQEVNFIYSIGQNLGFNIQEISMIFANMVQRSFVPSLDAIS